ncbi:MAG: hypothetical protein HYS27_12105 [Deltaproteobacteria bacterium]|nr:hypothetical protein [Deltaproteobacteria bacterium]
MDALLFHPKVVHLPMALAVLMPLVAGGLLLAWWRAWLPARGWLVAVLLQATLVLSGVIALRTGEAEEEKVEKVVAEHEIEEHEEAAQAFTAAAAGALVLMVAASMFGARKAGLPLAGAATVATLVVLVLGYRTGQEGGRLVYTHGAAQAYTSGAVAGGTGPANAADDDD